MMDSILSSIKKLIGIVEEDTTFDTDLIISINSVLGVLTQLGVGPKEGFKITGPTEKWSDFLPPGENLEYVKTYVHQRVKIIFDPPASSTHMDAIKSVIDEFEWRSNIQSECEE